MPQAIRWKKNVTTLLPFLISAMIILGFPGGSEVKAAACFCLQCKRPGFHPWVGKIPWRRKWQPTPVLLPGKSHWRRSLVGYSPQGRKESDTTERLHFHFHVCVHSAIQSCPALRPHGLVPWTYYVCSLIYINIRNKIYYLGRGYFCWKGEINTTVTISDLLIKNKKNKSFS